MFAMPPTTRRSVARGLGALLCAAALAAPALAQDATLEQVYQAAHGGHLDQALQMMEPVLRDHPNSAKAHYVEAELLAQQGRLGPARTELATAERLAPGLPFVQEPTLKHLRQVLDGGPAATARSPRSPLTMPAAEAASATPGRPLAWGLALAIGFGALLGWLLTRASRPRPAPAAMPSPMGPMAAPSMAAGPSMAWPRADATPVAGTPWGTAPMAAAPASTGAASGPGWGSQVASAAAGGLAAGAAVVAGEALGRRLFGHDTATMPAAAAFDPRGVERAPSTPDPWADADFGVRDAGAGWDDAVDDAGGLGGNWDV